jgi:hypothetical protein
MAKIYNISTGKEDEFIPLEKARLYIIGRDGNPIEPKSLRNKIYKGHFPPGTVTKNQKGNWWFSQNYLMGFSQKPAA